MDTDKTFLNQRRMPVQARARATYSAILEAAAQLLERHGKRGFTANKVAERAGVSIGSFYQYFPNKDAILLAIAEREEADLPKRARPDDARETQTSALRGGIRAYINMLPDHPRTRKAALELVLQARGPVDVGREIDRRFDAAGAFAGLSSAERFVVSRAVVGVVQAAVLEEREDLTSADFEDCLVRLALGVMAM